MSLILGMACLAAILMPAAAPAVSPLHAIEVYGEGSSSEPLTIFETARCEKQKGGDFFAFANSRDGDLLTLRIPNFHGYHQEYSIEQGETPGNPTLNFFKNTGDGHATVFSNEFVPSYESVEIGEALFREGGRLLGIGYGPSMYDSSRGKAIFMTGVVECEKPKKKGKPKGKGGGKKGGGKKGKA
jgi:hypothetical protein